MSNEQPYTRTEDRRRATLRRRYDATPPPRPEPLVVEDDRLMPEGWVPPDPRLDPAGAARAILESAAAEADANPEPEPEPEVHTPEWGVGADGGVLTLGRVRWFLAQISHLDGETPLRGDAEDGNLTHIGVDAPAEPGQSVKPTTLVIHDKPPSVQEAALAALRAQRNGIGRNPGQRP